MLFTGGKPKWLLHVEQEKCVKEVRSSVRLGGVVDVHISLGSNTDVDGLCRVQVAITP